MTDHTAKNLVGRDLINLRDALRRARPYMAKNSPSSDLSGLLMRIDTLIYRHADPELDIAKMWAAGDYRPYPVVEEPCCDGSDPACPTHGVAASNARQNEFYRRNPRG